MNSKNGRSKIRTSCTKMSSWDTKFRKLKVLSSVQMYTLSLVILLSELFNSICQTSKRSELSTLKPNSSCVLSILATRECLQIRLKSELTAFMRAITNRRGMRRARASFIQLTKRSSQMLMSARMRSASTTTTAMICSTYAASRCSFSITIRKSLDACARQTMSPSVTGKKTSKIAPT